MRVMSLVRNWLYGLGVFMVMTASLVVAFGVAISGPPTDEEMASVDEALGMAGNEVGRIAQQVQTQVCEDWPELCGAETTVAEAPPPEVESAPAPPRYETQIAEAPPIETSPPDREADDALLGDRAGAVTAAPEVRRRTAEATPAPRRSESRPRTPAPRRSARTPTPVPPIEVEQRSALARLLEGVESVLASVPPVSQASLPPEQAEQKGQSEGDEGYWDEGAPDEEYWDDDLDWRAEEEEAPDREYW